MRDARESTIGLGPADFPTTDVRLLTGFRSERADVRRGHLEEYCARYWKPVYAYFRALGRHNGSLGKPDYPRAVLAAWKVRWGYQGATS